MVTLKKKIGDIAEERACVFLQAQGLKLITKNFRSKMGEIDLIMQDGQDIVFVEVRSRANNYYGDAIESVDHNKQRKIIATALFFLQQRDWLDKVNYRFDVIGIQHEDLEWIEDAFADTL